MLLLLCVNGFAIVLFVVYFVLFCFMVCLDLLWLLCCSWFRLLLLAYVCALSASCLDIILRWCAKVCCVLGCGRFVLLRV